MVDETQAWEERLNSEGLAVIGGSGSKADYSAVHSGTRDRLLGLSTEAGEQWRSWANDVGESIDAHPELTYFGTVDMDRRKAIWAQYSEGKSYSEIAAAVGCHSRTVARTVARIRDVSPPPPCRNPLDHNPLRLPFVADQDIAARLLEIAGECADPWLLRERVSADPKLSRIGALMPKIPTVRYAKIELRQDMRFPNLPGGRDKAFLENVDGRAHAGGIDVICGDTVVTVPWGGIRSATRAVEIES